LLKNKKKNIMASKPTSVCAKVAAMTVEELILHENTDDHVGLNPMIALQRLELNGPNEIETENKVCPQN
jgi:hypothetical protein